MPLRKPRALRAGDTVRLVSPASPISGEKLIPISDLLTAQGYRVQVATHALKADGYLAGTDEQRASDLEDAFAAPEVAAVVCTRGGYGCARLMNSLDLDKMAISNKLLCGFSDITTLHLALNQRGLPTLHAPMALTLFYPREAWVLDSFLRALQGDHEVSPDVPAGITLKGGFARGIAAGGCLCLLTDSIRTAFELDAAGKILFIEDVDESPHRVDAMLTHLLNTGILQKASAIVFGEMTRTDERIDQAIGGRTWREIVKDRTESLKVPIIVDYPFGHAKNMLTLGLGVEVEVNADAGTVRYLEPVCV